MPSSNHIRNGLIGALVIGTGSALIRSRNHRSTDTRPKQLTQSPHVKAARRLNRAAGLIASSVLLDSAVEHYTGSFHNKAMFTPLIVSVLTLGVSAHGRADKSSTLRRFRNMVYATAALTGFAGTGFHIFNILKRPGGFTWQNLFYGSPLGAPAAISAAGVLGYYSEQLRRNQSGKTPKVFGLPAGRVLAALTSIGLAVTSGEAALLHFRGAYHDPFMYAPVTVPPIAAALLGETTFSHPRRPRAFTRWWLRLTALIGFAGAGFHIFGVHRMMGGWHNSSQNLLNGPPIPAPPSFTGLALAGLAALGLLEDHPDA